MTARRNRPRLTRRLGDAAPPVEPLDNRQRDRILLRAPQIQDWYYSLQRPQQEPVMQRARSPDGVGVVVVVDDQLGGYLSERTGNESVDALEGLLCAVAQLVEVSARHHASLDDAAFAKKIEGILRQDELIPPGPLQVKRFPNVASEQMVVALCTKDPDASVIDKGLFGQPRHVRDGYAPGEARFIHPTYGDDPPNLPASLSLRRDLVPLFADLSPDEEGRGIVFVEAATGVRVDVPSLSPETVKEAVGRYWRKGVYSSGFGRDSYTLTRGATGTLIFSAPYRMDLELAVALASAWSLAANKGNFFLQGGRGGEGEHRFFLTP